MGLIDSLRRAIGSTEPAESDDGTDSSGMFSIPESAVKDTVDVESRTSIIAKHYDGVSRDQAEKVAEILEDYHESTDGYTTDSIINDATEATGLSEDLLERIVRTESQSISWMRSISNYSGRSIDDIEVKLAGPDDDRAHPICTETMEVIDERGGGVPIEEMKQILTQKATEYKDDGGTPERMDHWVPYEMCRFAITRHVE